MGMLAHPSSAVRTEEAAVHQRACQILVVDDDPSFVHLLKESLQLEGYKVHCGYDGQAALQLAHQYAFHLIILDVNMPMTNGLKVFEYLRSSPDTVKIPVIFITGELSKDVYSSIARHQRVAHLKKPLDLESFNSVVRLFLDSYPVT